MLITYPLIYASFASNNYCQWFSTFPKNCQPQKNILGIVVSSANIDGRFLLQKKVSFFWIADGILSILKTLCFLKSFNM